MTKDRLLKTLMQSRRDVIDRALYHLALDFHTPARDTINRACDELGITRAQWDRMQTLRIQQEATR